MEAFVSFGLCTLLIAFISWYKTKSTNLRTVKGLLLAGKNNGYLIVASSLILTNLSANQFIGENESVYLNNLSVMAWGITSVVAMLLVSEYFLPIYFKGGMITTPDFLAKRYDEDTKRLVSIIFLLSYTVNLLPPVLYGGAVALTGMFHLPSLWGISYWQSIWLLVWLLGLIGSAYTILGGLRAITISDTLLGIGLLLLAIVLPFYGLRYLGKGDLALGLTLLLSKHTSHLNAIGTTQDAVPFSTIFTGMLLVNLYYWGIEQYIVQQTFAAKNLKEAQKGMALAALSKLFMPLLINLPGLIAVHLYAGVENTASIFPQVAADTLPNTLLGITTALVFGAAITTYNAGLHGSSTLFVMNLYLPYLEKKHKTPTETQLVRTAKRFELLLSMIAMIAAPFILFVDSGFYTYLQRVAGLFSMPIFTIIVVGFINQKVPPIAAKIGLLFFMVAYFICEYILVLTIHYLHILAILFLLTVFIMIAISFCYPSKNTKAISINLSHSLVVPWKNRHIVNVVLLILMVLIYIIFSPFVLAS
ncbi:MAG: solute:sodium symporter family transporter [Pseudosphingobacterium sp.]|uniref:solute:sodium symporter family transporter n=1 Tax=Olivibacter jilunii TaxID=985016 RepID=UPI0029A60C8E|nr:solute:sodium symporter family transporter [Olivibacter sp. UJ_SKK_5.1]MDX3915594.1 solute:sodium symporter family transporter [Pseudosphingobacterium sp.]